MFIETKLFSRLIEEYLSDDSYRQLLAALASNPEAGPLIPGSGGLRKLRWGIQCGGEHSITRASADRQIKKEIDNEKDKGS